MLFEYYDHIKTVIMNESQSFLTSILAYSICKGSEKKVG